MNKAESIENLIVQEYIDDHKKDRQLGFFLALFLGPLGLLYSNWKSALIVTLILFMLIPVTGVFFSVYIMWPLSVLISLLVIPDYNDKVKTKARLILASKNSNSL